MLKFKSFIFKISLSIIFFFLIAGHLGLALFSAHMFSLLRNQFWVYFNEPSLKACALAITIIAAIVLVLLAFDMSYEFHKIFAIIASLLMLIAFALVIYILTRINGEKEKHLREIAPMVLQNAEQFPVEYKCTWNFSETSSDLADCKEKANDYINLRLHWTFNWYLAYLLCWTISFIIAVPIIFFGRKTHID